MFLSLRCHYTAGDIGRGRVPDVMLVHRRGTRRQVVREKVRCAHTRRSPLFFSLSLFNHHILLVVVARTTRGGAWSHASPPGGEVCARCGRHDARESLILLCARGRCARNTAHGQQRFIPLSPHLTLSLSLSLSLLPRRPTPPPHTHMFVVPPAAPPPLHPASL